MKISFITTVFNEAKTIEKFLESLISQTKLPNEIIIVDGGSKDGTVQKVANYIEKNKAEKLKRIKTKVLEKPGNRSVGRNEAVKQSSGEIIVCSDSGNILDKDWIKNIVKPFNDKSVDVVAGYYKGRAKNLFQKCLVPYALVMPDKVNPNKFLPATRSIAFTKAIWKKVGKFDEEYSHNEDYVFAKKLQSKNAKIVFARDAIVNWIPRNTFKEAFTMFFRFAFGDAESGIIRPKVLLLFLRYFIVLFILHFIIFYQSINALIALLVLLAFYIYWAIKKNYKYVNEKKAFFLLPRIQFVADAAVLYGTSLGVFKKNKLLFLIIAIYILMVGLTLFWGTPNVNHPFPYHMDEWHQFMAIKAILKEGTTTIAGAAQIPFVFPIISGLYLVPFYLFQAVDPFQMQSAVDALSMQQRLFEILRSINLYYGVGCIILLAVAAKRFLKINYALPIYFFTISPVLIMLSGYFKYDIGLLFWLMLAMVLIFRFGETPNLKNYILAAIACSLAFSTKFSAIPLIPILVFAGFIFGQNKQKYKWIFIGICVYIVTFFLIGSPNFLYGKANYTELLSSNLNQAEPFLLHEPWWTYILFKQFPLIFGHGFYYLSIGSLIYLLITKIVKPQWNSKVSKYEILLVLTLILFMISLIPLKLGASGNRALVLLPFFALVAGIVVSKLYVWAKPVLKYFIVTIIFIVGLIQFYETASWISVKLLSDPQKISSQWIESSIPKKSVIGIENIPIYQGLPNIVVKEYYFKEYKMQQDYKYSYQVVDCKTVTLPEYVIVTNDEIEPTLVKNSQKGCLVNRLKNAEYKKVVSISPDFRFYKYFANGEDYSQSGLIITPLTTAVYKKPLSN